MVIDRTHYRWAIFSAIVTVAGLGLYVLYPVLSVHGGIRLYLLSPDAAPDGRKGDSWLGLLFGTLSAAFLVFAVLLSVRKRMLRLRVGTIAAWMRAHLWLGLLTLPLALYHGAFSLGGPLTTWLMLLLIVVVVSGLIGAAFQHFYPITMSAELPDESPYEQLERKLVELRREAYVIAWGACGAAPEGESAQRERVHIERSLGEGLKGPPRELLKKAGEFPSQPFIGRFYVEALLPFLRRESGFEPRLMRELDAKTLFDAERMSLDMSLHPHLAALEAVCDEVRQSVRQARMQWVLHGWLLVHLPLAWVLVALLLIHIVMALFY